MADQVGRAVDRGHRRTRDQAAQGPDLVGPDRLRRRGGDRRRHLHPHRVAPRATSPGPSISISFVSPRSPAGWRRCATPSSPRPCRSRAAPTRSPTRRFGEFIAWIIGWDLILEFALGAAVVAKGWSTLPGHGVRIRRRHRRDSAGSTFDWGALLIVAFVTTLLALGTKLSANVSAGDHRRSRWRWCCWSIVVGAFYIKAANYSPFIPPAESGGGGSGHRPVAVLAAHRRRRQHTTAGTACWPARRSCSSRSSASTSSPPPRRRPRTRSATCRAASSARWRSSPCSTSRWRSC